MSYPLTGSTGDGYRFAQELGHQVRKPQPSLVPLEVEQDFVKQMQVKIEVKKVMDNGCACAL
jgi:predicted flavoprotein YhiN